MKILLLSRVGPIIGSMVLTSWAGASPSEYQKHTSSQVFSLSVASPQSPSNTTFPITAGRFRLAQAQDTSTPLPSDEEVINVTKNYYYNKESEENENMINKTNSDIAEIKKYLADPSCCTGWQMARDAAQDTLRNYQSYLNFLTNHPNKADSYVYSVVKKDDYEGNIICYVNLRTKGTDKINQVKVTIKRRAGRWVLVDEEKIKWTN